jgi:hypothetical protein
MAAHFRDETFWVADDGSWGYGWIATYTKEGWSNDQHRWLERYVDEHDEPDMDVIDDIDKGIEPDWEY